jgi:hypothetical protein
MKAEDFSAWLSGIAGLSAATRGFGGAHERGRWQARSGREVSLEAPPGKATRRGRREDALGSPSHERVESHGCPHCAGGEVVGLGPLARAFVISLQELRAHIQRADQHPDGASAQEGALARSRRGDDRGQRLAKTAQLCGVHPTTAFRWRHRFLRTPASDKPRMLRGIVEAGETFVLESFKGRWSDLARKARKRGGRARHPGLHQDNTLVLVARDLSRPAIISSMTEQRYHRFRPQSWDSVPRRATPGKPTPGAPYRHVNNVSADHSRFKQWLDRSNGVATKNLSNSLGWRRALEAWGDQLALQTWIKGAIRNGPY